MTLAQLYTNMQANWDGPSYMPPTPAGPLYIDAEMVEKADKSPEFCGRLHGFKGPIYWTTGAVEALAKKGILKS